MVYQRIGPDRKECYRFVRVFGGRRGDCQAQRVRRCPLGTKLEQWKIHSLVYAYAFWMPPSDDATSKVVIPSVRDLPVVGRCLSTTTFPFFERFVRRRTTTNFTEPERHV
jgi:hypothetical protein